MIGLDSAHTKENDTREGERAREHSGGEEAPPSVPSWESNNRHMK